MGDGQTVTTNAAATIADVKTSNTVHPSVEERSGPATNISCSRNRQMTGFDASLPAAGLLIWHIDEAQTTNTNENHYKVALMPGGRQARHGAQRHRGRCGRPLSGQQPQQDVQCIANPSSKSYSNADSCVAVTAIGASGASMTMQIQVKCAAGHPAPSAAAAKVTASAVAPGPGRPPGRRPRRKPKRAAAKKKPAKRAKASAKRYAQKARR